MSKSMIEFVVGDLEEKRTYRQLMKRVKALPKDYRFAFKKMQHYMYNFGTAGSEMTMIVELVELFEISAMEGKEVSSIIGSDVATFCDELMRVAASTLTTREQLNQEIAEHFYERENSYDKYN